MNPNIKNQLKKFTWQVFIIHFVIIASFSFASILYNDRIKKELSLVIFKALKNDFLSGDLRKVAYLLNPLTESQFLKIILVKDQQRINFPVGESKHSPLVNSMANSLVNPIVNPTTLTYDLFYDDQRKIKTGEIIFVYNRMAYLGQSFIGGIFILLILAPLFIMKQRKKIIWEFQRNLMMEKESIFADMAKNVAHDIRSPLASLSMMTREMPHLSEDERVQIRRSVNRIQDIASHLLSHSLSQSSLLGQESRQAQSHFETTHFLSNTLEEIVAEKRIEYRPYIGLDIDFNPGREAYGLFVEVSSPEFKRTISNIINNAVEAMQMKGKVLITLELKLKGENQQVAVSIIDQGPGMSAEIINNLGKPGITYGKKNGHGLGLYQAKRSLETWKGDLSVTSKLGLGTTVTLTLPLAPAPFWFVPELILPENCLVTVADDDASIHQIWQRKILSLPQMDLHLQLQLQLQHFTNLGEWKKDYQQRKEQQQRKLKYEDKDKDETSLRPEVNLIDYEFYGQNQSGLDVIEELGIVFSSILVTDLYDDPKILKRCRQLNLRIIPKMMVDFLPLQISHKTYEAVFIDDDEFLRRDWLRSAKKKNINLLTLATTQEFEFYTAMVTPQTTFYIDSKLRDGDLSGQEWAEKLYERGYHNLYLATGFPAQSFSNQGKIKVRGKIPPWEEE